MMEQCFTAQQMDNLSAWIFICALWGAIATGAAAYAWGRLQDK